MVQQKNPYSRFNFAIEFGDERGNSGFGGFEEIEGLSAPDANARARMPGMHKHTNLTLKRGVLGGALFRVWSSAIEKGQRVPGTLKIIPHDKSLEPWTFTNVFPIKYSGPNLNADGNEVSVETIEITAEGMATEKGCDR
jgi:phage tail-like protein